MFKERLKETQGSFNSRLDKALKNWRINWALRLSPRIRCEWNRNLNSFEIRASAWNIQVFITFLVFSGISNTNDRFKKPHRLTANRSGSPTLLNRRWNETMERPAERNYLATSLEGPSLSLLGNLSPSTRQGYKELVAALESRFGSAHQQKLHRYKFKTRVRRREESLQELAEDLERSVSASLPSRPRRDEGSTSKGAIQWCAPGRKCKITTEAESAPVRPGCSDASYGAGIVPISLPPKGISSSRHVLWCNRREFNWWSSLQEILAWWCTCTS